MQNRYCTATKIIMFLVLGISISTNAYAAVYYIDKNNSNARDSNPGTISSPWMTITKANNTVGAGDTVYIRAGTYSSYIAPQVSGTSSQRITYRNYGSEVVTIRNAAFGIHLNGKSYITVQGIHFDYLDRFLWLENNSKYNNIVNNVFSNARNAGWSASMVWRGSSYNRVTNNTFYKNTSGPLLNVGDETVQNDFSSHNLIENNTFYHGHHHMLGIYGQYNIVKNNWFHNEAWRNGYGDRNIFLAGYAANSGWNLIEGNRIGYTYIPPKNWGAAGMELSNGYNIVRKNLYFYNDLAGLNLATGANVDGRYSYASNIVYNKIYNNTFMRNAWNDGCNFCQWNGAIVFYKWSGSNLIENNAIKNNLYYSHYRAYGVAGTSLGSQIFAGNFDGDKQGNPLFVKATNNMGDPFDSTYPDLHLNPGSPAIDAGTYLTKISSNNGSGTSFQVEDSRYFIDGWGIVQGDEIQLYGTSQKAVITNINYSTHTITVDKTLSWTINQGVSLAYGGTAPDAGAYEVSQNDVSQGKAPDPPQILGIQ